MVDHRHRHRGRVNPSAFLSWRNALESVTACLGREAGQIVAFYFELEFVVAAIGGSLSSNPVLSTLGREKFLIGPSKVGHEQLRIGAAFGGVDLKSSEHLAPKNEGRERHDRR